MRELIDLFLNVDEHLADFVQSHGRVVYGLLFAIIFAETGLVITPFLPGDSLLFAAGALAGSGMLDVRLILLIEMVVRGSTAAPRRASDQNEN